MYHGGYLEYFGVFSTMGDIMMHVGDIMSTLGVFSTVEEIFCYLSTPLYFTPPW